MSSISLRCRIKLRASAITIRNADARRVDWQRQPDRRARRLVDIRQKTLLTHLATDGVPRGFDEGFLRQSHDARRGWKGIKEVEEPVAAAVPSKPLSLGKGQGEIIRQDTVLDLGLCFGNGFVRLG